MRAMLFTLALLAPGLAVAGQGEGGQGVALPLDLGGPFTLTDQTGHARSEADPDGRHQLVFFGYVNCVSICTLAIPAMAEVATILDGEGIAVTPIVITVDPGRDTPEAMAEALPRYHPRMVGLTGSEEALAAVRDSFGVTREHLFDDPVEGAIFSHGSNIYVLGPDGGFLTVLPPVIPPAAAARIVAGFAAAG